MDNKPDDHSSATSHNEGSGQPTVDPDLKSKFVDILVKDYELAASRFDKTDDRVIQLISIGLAFFGLVVVILRQTSDDASNTTDATPTTSLTATPTATSVASTQGVNTSPQPNNVDSDVLLACVIFALVYIFLSALCVLFWELASRKDPYKGVKKRFKRKPNERPNPYIIRPSIWGIWGAGFAIGLLCIIIVGFVIRPTLYQVPLELLWLAPISLVIFHTVLIYIMSSAFGLIWYCRALSKRITNILFEDPDLPVLMRFERDQTPSVFFSFGRGNVKPRTTYLLLLGTIGFLFLWVTVVSFINIYASHPWEGAIMLAFYFVLEFNVVFALSGISYDMEKTHSEFVEDVGKKSQDEVRKLRKRPPKSEANEANVDKAQADGA